MQRILILPLTLGILISSVFMFSGCSTTKMVTIVTDPPEADIFLAGQKIGTGKVSRELDFSKMPVYTFNAKLYKYADASVDVKYQPKQQTTYSIKLERIYSISIPLLEFEISKTTTGLNPTLTKLSTVAYFDPLEASDVVRGLVQITDNKEMGVFYGAPVLSPSEDILVYPIIREVGGKSEVQIWKQVIGTQATTRLVAENAWALYPTFTPDGQAIIFSSNRLGGKFSLWRQGFTGTGRTKISQGLTQDFSSSVAPNGSQIVYTGFSSDGEVLQIWSISIDGRLPTQICMGFDPQVSPDGKKILFHRYSVDTKVPQLWVMDFGGGGETQLTDNTDYVIKDARWSPDGTMIVFASNEGKDSQGRRNFDIWIMKSDGSQKTQLTTNGSWDDKPCFDRHGEQIFFRSNRGGVWNIWSFKLGERFSKGRIGFEIR